MQRRNCLGRVIKFDSKQVHSFLSFMRTSWMVSFISEALKQNSTSLIYQRSVPKAIEIAVVNSPVQERLNQFLFHCRNSYLFKDLKWSPLKQRDERHAQEVRTTSQPIKSLDLSSLKRATVNRPVVGNPCAFPGPLPLGIKWLKGRNPSKSH